MKAQYTPQSLPYHLIVPSLPGYAFSAKPPLHREFGLRDVGQLLNQLMLDLGFGDGYVAQGGDIGSRLSRVLAVEHTACKACHLNYCQMYLPPTDVPKESVSASEAEGLERTKVFMERGAAYALEQATRPSTIGLVLASNPLALLAWIGEKFIEWTDETPELDTILEAVTLYWLTETFPTSIYPYRQVSVLSLDPVDGSAQPSKRTILWETDTGWNSEVCPGQHRCA